jgi:hypothetical protein
MPLADTLLRMAEAPRLYLPQWSQAIMDEVTRNLIAKWDMAPEKARQREEELRRHFPEAWVEGYEPLIDATFRLRRCGLWRCGPVGSSGG